MTPLHEDNPASREKFLALSRDYLNLLKKSLTEFRSKDVKGRAFVNAYSDIVDAIVGVLFQRAMQEHAVSPGKVEMAIIGTGGYGRSELAPYSDVDILVVCKRKTPAVKRVAASFIQLMWDVGFELGHSVQSLVESEDRLARHMDTRTALFESRWICGSRTTAREIETRISRLRRRDGEAYLRRKIKDALARRKKHGSSYQLIEPNVKLSAGGLRDFQTLVWLGMVVEGQRGLSTLRKEGLLLPGEVTVLEDAYDFLLRTRVELHLATESKQDQLTVRMQKVITDRLGYKPKGGHLGVELFMKDYYNHTRTVSTITEDVIDELLFGGNIGVLLGRGKLSKDRGKLSLRVNTKRLRREPLYVFALQKEAGTKLDRALKRKLETLLHGELKGRQERNTMRRDFAGLLEHGESLTFVLRSMHETGFLGVAIPEYNDLTSLKRYDLYHHYTVDEHSFQVVRNLELLVSSRSKRLAALSRLYSEVPDKQVLFLAALLHDIGKIEGRGHARKGAALARKILKRLFLKQEQIDQVSYLIEIHLVMSHFSQRRDSGDVDALRSFCSTVKNRTTLKYLCLLTYADLQATSPTAWTEWKRTLLWTLYLRAYQFMAKKEKKPEAAYKARKRMLLRAFLQGSERDRALRHLDMLPGRYLLTMSPSQVKRHLELIGTLDGRGVVATRKKGQFASEITFCTLDKPYRLSQLCGVLTMNDCNILFAYAFTRTDGKVIDVFHVEDISGTTPIDDRREEQIRKDLDGILAGNVDLRPEVRRHVSKWKRRKQSAIPIACKVEFENDLSDDVTIIDIFAMDQPGLLYKVTRTLSEQGLTIHRARISTEANQAIDSFDVQDKAGKKITSVKKLREIRERLVTEISEPS